MLNRRIESIELWRAESWVLSLWEREEFPYHAILYISLFAWVRIKTFYFKMVYMWIFIKQTILNSKLGFWVKNRSFSIIDEMLYGWNMDDLKFCSKVKHNSGKHHFTIRIVSDFKIGHITKLIFEVFQSKIFCAPWHKFSNFLYIFLLQYFN